MMIPDWLQVIFMSVAPITEYQLAIPVAMTTYHFPWYVAYALAFLGSCVIFFPLYFGFVFVRTHAVRLFSWLAKPFDAVIARAERKLHGDYEKYGALALFLALVVPFPLTGVWTATLAAVALKIPMRSAAIGILLGVLCGEALVTLASLGILRSALFTG